MSIFLLIPCSFSPHLAHLLSFSRFCSFSPHFNHMFTFYFRWSKGEILFTSISTTGSTSISDAFDMSSLIRIPCLLLDLRFSPMTIFPSVSDIGCFNIYLLEIIIFNIYLVLFHWPFPYVVTIGYPSTHDQPYHPACNKP